MKMHKIALLGGFFLPLAVNASTFSETLERLKVEDPEFFFHADVTNDFNALGGVLSEIYMAYLMATPDAPPIPVDFTKLFQHLGLSSMTSMTLASEAWEMDSFRNEGLVEFEGAPSGAFLLFGDSNEAFSVHKTAPADSDMVAELQFNGVVLFDIIRGVVIDMMGPMGESMIDAQMNQPLMEGGPTLSDLILRLTTRMEVALRPDFGADSQNSIGMAFMKGHGIVKIDDVADLLDSLSPMLGQAGFMPVEGAEGSSWILDVDTPDLAFKLYLNKVAESNDVMLSIGDDSIAWYTGASATVADTEEFKAFTSGLPDEGLSLWYATERLGILQIQNLDADLPEDPTLTPIFASLKKFLISYVGTQVSVSYLEGDSYRTTSIQPASLKTNLGMAVVGVSVGAAAGAIGAMQAMQADVPDPAATDSQTQTQTNGSPSD